MDVHAARRFPRFEYLGPHAYSVTCRTYAREPLFRHPATVAAVEMQLMQLSRDERFAVLAYCFMPDHVHLLVEGASARSDLPRMIARWKQRTGDAHRGATATSLWQGGFHDRVLRGDEDRLAVARHIIANPIRAGLVSDVEAYPFWGSGVWSRDEMIETLFERGAAHAESRVAVNS